MTTIASRGMVWSACCHRQEIHYIRATACVPYRTILAVSIVTTSLKAVQCTYSVRTLEVHIYGSSNLSNCFGGVLIIKRTRRNPV